MANLKKSGKKDIRTGEKDIAKGVLGPRGYNIVKGTDDIIRGEKRIRKAERKRK